MDQNAYNNSNTTRRPPILSVLPSSARANQSNQSKVLVIPQLVRCH